MRAFRHRLEDYMAPYAHQLQRAAAPRSLQFPEPRLVQFDSGTEGPVGTVWGQTRALWATRGSLMFLS